MSTLSRPSWLVVLLACGGAPSQTEDRADAPSPSVSCMRPADLCEEADDRWPDFGYRGWEPQPDPAVPAEVMAPISIAGVCLVESSDRKIRWTRDASGRPATYEVSIRGEPALRVVWTHDRTGHLVREQIDRHAEDSTLEGPSVRSEVDGRPDTTSSYRHSTRGSSRIVASQIDDDGDGTVDRTVEREFDASGRIERRETRALRGSCPPIGGRHELRTWMRDSRGRVREERCVVPGGARWSKVSTYDANGRRARMQYSRVDEWGARQLDFRYVYDARGRPIREGFDLNGDGTLDVLDGPHTRNRWRRSRDRDARRAPRRRRRHARLPLRLRHTRTTRAPGVLFRVRRGRVREALPV